MLLGMTRRRSTGSLWEPTVLSFTPALWLKCNEPNPTTLTADGNWGYDGGTVSGSFTGMVFGSAGIMPSDLSRATINRVSTTGSFINVNPLTVGVGTQHMSIYFVYKGISGLPAGSIWGAYGENTSGNRADLACDSVGGFIQIAINGSLRTTTVSRLAIQDGNAHLVGVVYTATTVTLYIDGASVWVGTFTVPLVTLKNWYYQRYGITSNCLLGNYGDFIIYNTSLSPTDNATLFAAWN